MKTLKQIFEENQFYKYHNLVGDNIFIYNGVPEDMLLSIITDTKDGLHMAQIVWSYNGDRLMTYLSLDKPKYFTSERMDDYTRDIIIKALIDNWSIVENTYPEIKSIPDYSKLPRLKK